MLRPQVISAMLMGNSSENLEIQVRQIRARQDIAQSWNIVAGASILEIGCGQGDMTAVLADAVGPSGRILAVDSAPPTYGAPTTLGESAQRLAASPLGDRIDFRFNFNLLETHSELVAVQFDAIVLAHCSWYFNSVDTLRATLLRLRDLSERLFLSEWDMHPESPDQVGHLLSVLLQGHLAAYSPNSESNIRTPLSRLSMRRLLQATGWQIERETQIDTSELDDARWEIAACYEQMAEVQDALPPRVMTLLQSQIEVLERILETNPCRSLPSYSIVARSN